MTRILIADDNEINCRLFGWQLESLGYECDAASNGRATLEACQGEAYDLLFLDLNLGDMEGQEVARTLRARGEDAGSDGVVIVAATAHTEQEYRDQAMAAGMNDFISKPFTLVPLATVLVRWGATIYERPQAADWPEHVSLDGAWEALRALEAKASHPGLAAALVRDFQERAPAHAAAIQEARGEDPAALARDAMALRRHALGVGALRLARGLASGPDGAIAGADLDALVAEACAALASRCG